MIGFTRIAFCAKALLLRALHAPLTFGIYRTGSDLAGRDFNIVLFKELYDLAAERIRLRIGTGRVYQDDSHLPGFGLSQPGGAAGVSGGDSYKTVRLS